MSSLGRRILFMALLFGQLSTKSDVIRNDEDADFKFEDFIFKVESFADSFDDFEYFLRIFKIL